MIKKLSNSILKNCFEVSLNSSTNVVQTDQINHAYQIDKIILIFYQ